MFTDNRKIKKIVILFYFYIKLIMKIVVHSGFPCHCLTLIKCIRIFIYMIMESVSNQFLSGNFLNVHKVNSRI